MLTGLINSGSIHGDRADAGRRRAQAFARRGDQGSQPLAPRDARRGAGRPDADHLSDDAKQLIKFHGSYQQEDRDARKNRAKAGVGKAYMFMIRLKLPGGKLTADQYLAMDDIAGKYANGTLRFTTRQSIQFHGVLKGDLKARRSGHQRRARLDARRVRRREPQRDGLPGPARRPGPRRDATNSPTPSPPTSPRGRPAPTTKSGSTAKPRQPRRPRPAPDGVEPIYGKVYLPRKFKVGFALPDDNCIDILAQCLGFLAVVENGKTVGYNLYAGGGRARRNGNAGHLPAPRPAGLLRRAGRGGGDAAEAVVKLFRDHGNRADRKRARIKYVDARLGRREVPRGVRPRLPRPSRCRLPKDAPITDVDLHHGWQPQGDGKWFLGLSVENGRVKDEGADAAAVRRCARSSSRFGADVRAHAPAGRAALRHRPRRTSRPSIRC